MATTVGHTDLKAFRPDYKILPYKFETTSKYEKVRVATEAKFHNIKATQAELKAAGDA
jgi:hypothetical protein